MHHILRRNSPRSATRVPLIPISSYFHDTAIYFMAPIMKFSPQICPWKPLLQPPEPHERPLPSVAAPAAHWRKLCPPVDTRHQRGFLQHAVKLSLSNLNSNPSITLAFINWSSRIHALNLSSISNEIIILITPKKCKAMLVLPVFFSSHIFIWQSVLSLARLLLSEWWLVTPSVT